MVSVRSAAVVLVLLPMLVSSNSHAEPDGGTSEQHTVPMTDLLTRPASLKGQRVRILGFWSGRLEESAVFSDVEALKEPDFSRSIWVRLRDPSRGAAIPYGTEIVVSGRFKPGPGGHMGVFQGEIVDAEIEIIPADRPKGAQRTGGGCWRD